MSNFNVELIGDDAILIKLEEKGTRVHDALRREMDLLAIEVQGLVKAKLSGPVLHNRTGLLRDSINIKVTDTGENISESVGTNVIYAAIHEYGFDDEETVSAHIRRSRMQMAMATKTYKNKFGTISKHVAQTGRYGKSTGEIQVRSFTRNMVMPERSYLRSTLREQTGTIRTRLADAVMAAMKL